jgi:hypothetical protein
VAGAFAVLTTGLRVGMQVLDVGELVADRVVKFGTGDEDITGLADVGVGVGSGVGVAERWPNGSSLWLMISAG